MFDRRGVRRGGAWTWIWRASTCSVELLYDSIHEVPAAEPVIASLMNTPDESSSHMDCTSVVRRCVRCRNPTCLIYKGRWPVSACSWALPPLPIVPLSLPGSSGVSLSRNLLVNKVEDNIETTIPSSDARLILSHHCGFCSMKTDG